MAPDLQPPGDTGRRYTNEYKRLALWKEMERVWQGETIQGFCEEIGHSRASHYRWKGEEEEFGGGLPQFSRGEGLPSPRFFHAAAHVVKPSFV